MARATKISTDTSFLDGACEQMDEEHRGLAFYTPLITAPESTAATASIVRVAKPVLFNIL